jgi:hypothetical protein
MKKITLTSIILALALTGCFRHTYIAGNGGVVEKYSKWQHHFIFGLVNASGPINVDDICKNSADFTIEEQQSFGNGVVRLFTAGIYDPTSVTVLCAPRTK